MPINYVFHLADVTQPTYPPIKRLVGASVPLVKKLSLIRRVLDALHGSYRLVTTEELVRDWTAESSSVRADDAVAVA